MGNLNVEEVKKAVLAEAVARGHFTGSSKQAFFSGLRVTHIDPDGVLTVSSWGVPFARVKPLGDNKFEVELLPRI